jgi:hypothetical protein
MDDINARARLLAVEVLLSEPELLGNDALETDLYILRDKLWGAPGAAAAISSLGKAGVTRLALRVHDIPDQAD